MNIFRNFTALIIVLSMLAASTTLAVSGNEMVNNSAEINKLRALGLWQDQEHDATATRAGFAVLIANMLGLNNFGLTLESESFQDVGKDDYGYNEIEALCQIGILSTGNQNFRPNDAIAFEEAVKMLVSVLGYDIYAQVKGGYPSGYLMTAHEKNIIPKNMSTSLLTYGDVAKMIEHAIDVGILARISFGSVQRFEVKNDVTVLSEYHRIFAVEGVIEAAGETRLSKVSPLNKDKVQIDGEVMNKGNTKVNELFGYNVKGFYKKEKHDDQGTLLFIEENRNRIVELQGRNIKSFESGVLYYRVNETSQRLNSIAFPISMEVIINNRLSVDPGNLSANTFENVDRVIFIDNDNNGQYDVLRIYIEEVVVVNSVNATEKKVYAKYEAGKSAYDFEERLGREILINNAAGAPIEFEEIREWTVLNIVSSADDMQVHAVVSNRRFSGVVNEISIGPSWYETEVKIDGVLYEFAKSVKTIDLTNDIIVGTRYTFYTDCTGKIAAANIDESGNDLYGYLIAIDIKGISDEVRFKMFTQNNAFEILTNAERVTIDGKGGLKGNKILTELKKDEYGLTTDTFEPKPVRYKLNAAGELTYIDTPHKGDREDVGSQLDYDNNTLTLYKSYNQVGKMNYISSDRIFGGQVRIGSRSVVMYVPWFDDDPDKLDDIKYWSYDKVENWTSRTTNTITGEFDAVMGGFSAYDVSSDRTANLVVIRSNAGGGVPVKAKTLVTIVDKITHGLDWEGTETSVLRGYQGSEKIRIPFEAGYNPNKKYGGTNPNDPNEQGAAYTVLEPGDLIRIALNQHGEINHYDKLFSFKDRDDPKVVRIGNDAVNPYMYDIQENTKSLLAVTTKKDAVPSHEQTPKIWYGSGYEFQGNAFYMAYGVISEKFGDVVLIEGAPGINTYRELFKTTNKPIHIIEEDAEGDIKIYPAKVDELVSVAGSGLDAASRVIYYTYSAKPGGLIVIKRND